MSSQAAEQIICPDDHRQNYVTQMRVVPGPVAVICAAKGDERSGLAATAWNSLCADPPMLLVCVNHQASAHGIIAQANAFSVNLIAATDTETVQVFSAQRGLSGRDRFLAGEWQDGPLGQPMRKDAAASFECELEASHAYGTHTIYIGRVRSMRGTPDTKPLIYMNGQFCTAEAIA